MKLFFTALTFVFFSFVGFAQETTAWESGFSLKAASPQENLNKTYDAGIGIYGHTAYNINDNFSWRIDAGWLDFTGPERIYVDENNVTRVHHPERTLYDFSTGFRAKASIFYLETRAGFITGIKKFSVTPGFGLRIWKIDLQANYTLAGDDDFMGLRLGYFYTPKSMR